MPLVIARMLDRDCHLLANDILERNRMIFREKLNYEMKWLGDPFTSTEGLQEKNIFTQWSLYTNDSMFLGVRHKQTTPFSLADSWVFVSGRSVTLSCFSL